MELTNADAQDVQLSPNAQEPSEDQPKQFDDMTPDELIKMVANLQNRLHTVNEESKGRKIKLRELEAEKTERENKLLEEQGKYKELYESVKTELDSLLPLKDFKERYDKLQADRVIELEKQLTAGEREELAILSDALSTDKRVQWIELKLKNRTSASIDSSSSVQSGGSLKKLPTNKAEMRLLSTEDIKRFKEKYPQQYMSAMSK